jgi:hypothetical protein
MLRGRDSARHGSALVRGELGMPANPYELTPTGLERSLPLREYMRFFLLAWAIYLLSTPFYIFPPGIPQPSDGFIAVLILLLMTGYAMRIPLHRDLYLVGAIFLVYVALVNWYWWTQYRDLRFLLSSLYYPFNFMVFVFTVTLLYKFRGAASRVTLVSLVLTTGVVLVYALVNFGGVRQQATFNNPNQFGYWTLLAMGCFLVAKGEQRLRLVDLTFIGPVSYLAALSLSKAVIGSITIMLVASAIGQGMERKLKVAAIAIVLVVSPIIVLETGAVGEFLSQGTAGAVIARMENIGGQRDDSLAGRGYDRIWLYPEYLIFGAGEGAYDRFDRSQAAGQEIHSSVGTMFFCYGILGSALFCVVLYVVLRQARWRDIVYFSTVSLYGFTHQGLRTTTLWVFLGLIYGMVHYVRRPLGIGSLPPSVPGITPGKHIAARSRRLSVSEGHDLP